MPSATASRLFALLATASQTRPRQWRYMARAWLAAPSLELSMRTAGVKRTLGWIEQLPLAADGPSPHERIDVAEASRLVRWACKLQPLARNACLTQSLVQYALHRRDGVAARFVIGVRHVAPEGSATERSTAEAGASNPNGDTTDNGRADDRPGVLGLDAHAWVQSPNGPNASTGFTELLQRELS